ncbi:MAG: DUF3991 and toprim domain-containing protein [Methylococcaceae bacterium]|nr:DUF3991 and toprim domain-containing protein [Methylococcaceae bacterium]
MKALIERLGLKPKGGKVFFNEHHRVTITGDLWNCHQCEKGGAGSIALVMHVLDLGFIHAREWLGDDVSIPMPVHTPKPPTALPVSDKSTLSAVIAYLCDTRGLNHVMVEWCIQRGLIYSDSKRNACFKYGDGVAMRGTGSVGFRANRGVLTEPFTIPARSNLDGVAILESAIDALSYRQLNPTKTVCAIAGNANGVLMRYVLDMAARLDVPVCSKANDGVNAIIQHRPPLDCKDWNDLLLRYK